jgi:hypothetical protein
MMCLQASCLGTLACIDNAKMDRSGLRWSLLTSNILIVLIDSALLHRTLHQVALLRLPPCIWSAHAPRAPAADRSPPRAPPPELLSPTTANRDPDRPADSTIEAREAAGSHSPVDGGNARSAAEGRPHTGAVDLDELRGEGVCSPRNAQPLSPPASCRAPTAATGCLDPFGAHGLLDPLANIYPAAAPPPALAPPRLTPLLAYAHIRPPSRHPADPDA